MAIDDIHWHDSLVLSVRIVPEKDTVEMRLLYPEEWRKNSFAERTVIFEEAYGYKEFEGPIYGSPTILSAQIAGSEGDCKLMRLETNAGYRELFCKDVFLVEPKMRNR
ncbi:MAG: hypothetical protein VW687_06775 [Curvibacter sp.]